MSRDVDVSTVRAFLVRISGQQFPQYLFADCAARRKLQPHHSQYFASRIVAPAGTLWVSYSRSPCQRASVSLLSGIALLDRRRIGPN